jgi:hypothetical protein
MSFDITRLALALAAYHAEKGEYPEKLETLAPDYLKIIPQDLFTSQPLKYRRDGQGYLLYSLGPDLQDYGGTDVRNFLRSHVP